MENRILCVICVRGGSKRLPKKNLQMYGDKTLTQHAILHAVRSKYIDKLVFGTEDEEIITHVKKIRDSIQVKDWHPKRTTMMEFDIDVLSEAITEGNVSMYEPVRQILLKNEEYNLMVILQADNPVKEGLIDQCIEKWFEMDKKIRGEKIEDDKQYFEEVSTFYDNVRTGSVRVITRGAFLSPLPTSKIAMVEDRQDYIDIQYKEDLDKANYLLKHPHHDTFWVKNKIKEPIQYNTHMIYNHFGRYTLAVKKLNINIRDRVIDASCGQGYGSFLLSMHAGTVFGLDVNPEYLKTAKKHYNKNNLHFASYETFYLYEKPVDKIVFIETFEHIPKDESIEFIADLFAYLNKGGSMFLTAPLGDNEPSEYNEFHLNEPSLDMLETIFEKYFEQRDITIDTFVNSYGKMANYCMMTLNGFTGIKNECREKK